MTLSGVPVTVIQVPSYVVHNPADASQLLEEYGIQFSGSSIILAGMAGPKPVYFGDRNLISRLRRVPAYRIHWEDQDSVGGEYERPDIGENPVAHKNLQWITPGPARRSFGDALFVFFFLVFVLCSCWYLVQR